MPPCFHVVYNHKAIKALNKLDPAIRKKIINWIDSHLSQSSNPRKRGTALTGKLSGLWRYRIGAYRVIVEIINDKIIILVLDVGHRRDIYRN